MASGRRESEGGLRISGSRKKGKDTQGRHLPAGPKVHDVLNAFAVERSTGQIHRQLLAQLRSAIRSRRLNSGDVLPSEHELAQLWGVARGTVRRALSDLAEEGLLERRQGRGTTVASPRIHQYLGRLAGFTEDMHSRGLEPRSEWLSLESVNPSLPLQQILACEDGLIWRLTRRRWADGMPVAIEVCHVGNGLLSREAVDQASRGSLYEVYRQRGIRPARAIQRVEAVSLDAERAELLSSRAGAPAFKLERITYDETERVIEVVESIYRGDCYSFQVELRGD